MKLTCALLIAAVVAAQGTQAQTPTTSQADKAVAHACKADAKHLCAGKTGQEAKQCLQSNADKLSSDCQNALSKVPKS